ncbi:MAG: hypothetical protein LC785_17180 [Acidobacteria bacterium]|nr:hypothetical protein [Acidobacteriota bacterium]MCA1643629.1 hypothetical protein [Acidobacteriota bacterium]
MLPALVLVNLTAKDQKNIASIIEQVEGVDTPAQALLWAAQRVVEGAQSPPGNLPPNAPVRGGGGGGLPDYIKLPPIRRRPTPLADIVNLGVTPAIEIRLGDLKYYGIKSHITVDAADLMRLGMEPELVRDMFSSATKGRTLSGGVAIPRAGLNILKK